MENYNEGFAQNQTGERGIFNSIEVDQNGKLNLAEAGKWSKFLGILGIIFLVLMILVGLGVMVMGSAVLDASPEMQGLPFSTSILGVIYLVMALIYIYPTWALFKFGSLIRSGIRMENQAMFNEGLAYLKGFFKFVGIFTIILIGLYIIAIVAMMVGIGIGGIQ